MTRPIHSIEGDSLLVGEMPMGCKQCARGSKMVLFVTGLCDAACFYCPLSQDKTDKDVVFADEMPVHNDSDILYESDAMGAEGAGLSGGDPLCRLERTTHYISLLKEQRGKDFHTHLYTAKSDIDEEALRSLLEAGLDEIRFHTLDQDWSGIESAIELRMKVGIEVPAIPGEEKSLRETAKRAEEIGVSFLNINELESSETNFQSLVSLGLRLRSMDSASIMGSAELASEIVHWAADELDSLSVHYCSSRFKDAIQMRNRLERRLERTSREFEERVEDEPLLILGVVRAPHGEQLSSDQLDHIGRVLEDRFEVPRHLMNIDIFRMRIEIAAWILSEIATDLKKALPDGNRFEVGVAHEYPSWDRLQTLFNPL